MLRNICKVPNALKVHCTAGTIKVNQQGELGSYPLPVWYNPKGIANIMSLHNVAKHYRLLMDTNKSNAIHLHKADGGVVTFTPSTNGLYKYEATDDENMDEFWSFIQTVQDQSDKYRAQQVEKAKLARRIQNIIMRPGSREFMDKSINHLKDCPVSRYNVQVADDIFGRNLGSVKGKTVYRPVRGPDG
ncbi:hypothetical protein ACA910_011026 [Epithemia clementina (nom. ined.)]